jgi:hypothetical protein
MRRPLTFASLCGFLVIVLRLQGVGAFELDSLQHLYAKNNSNEPPVVSWTDWGTAKFPLYSDGTIIAADRKSKSGLAATLLGPDELRAALSAVSAKETFWLLDSKYRLTERSEQQLNIVSVRVPGREHYKVSVYGRLKPRSNEDSKPPPAFTEFVETLSALIPEKMQPWDPGYVEILWGDYDYAPDRSLRWPSEWPGFDSSLVRPMTNAVIQKIMIFPSSKLPELDAFLARRLERGAILISGRKMSASYRWPLPGEKRWTSWDQ